MEWPARALMLWWYVFIDVLSGAPHDKRLLVVVCEDDNELVMGMMMTCRTTGIRMKHNGMSNCRIKSRTLMTHQSTGMKMN